MGSLTTRYSKKTKTDPVGPRGSLNTTYSKKTETDPSGTTSKEPQTASYSKKTETDPRRTDLTTSHKRSLR